MTAVQAHKVPASFAEFQTGQLQFVSIEDKGMKPLAVGKWDSTSSSNPMADLALSLEHGAPVSLQRDKKPVDGNGLNYVSVSDAIRHAQSFVDIGQGRKAGMHGIIQSNHNTV